MKKNKIISWMVSLLMLAFLASCADDSPVSSLEEEYYYSSSSSCTSIIDCVDAATRPHGYSSSSKKYSSSSYYYSNSYSSSSVSESEKCRLGTSSYSDSYCCSYYGYQCSYSSSSYVSESEKCRLGTSSYSDSYCCSYYGYQCSYTSNETEEEKKMQLTLTYYLQNKTSGEDRDPEISFKIYTLNDADDTLQSLKTGQLTDWDNVTFSDVRIMASPLTIAAGVAKIFVCPIIIDDDGLLGSQDLSSGYCYGRNNVGSLKDQDVVKQSDYENTKSELEWEWYLY
ncbi:MAG: hypothetical protein UH678_05960 [Fibrobacteraceae bacterium]|nr:hypothetical protein [Fibrobacteraceae bacterium]